MNAEEIIFQQYKLYTEQKEKFVDRSFQSNKFYLVLVIVLFLIMFLTGNFTFDYGLTSILIFSAAGFATCILWWINIDSYNFLIKVKLGKVIEDLETHLQIKPYTQEFIAIKDLRKNKRMFLFADMQKTFVVCAMLVYFVLFVNELIPMIYVK